MIEYIINMIHTAFLHALLRCMLFFTFQRASVKWAQCGAIGPFRWKGTAGNCSFLLEVDDIRTHLSTGL